MGKYFIYDSGYAAEALSCLSILVAMTAIPFIRRSIHCKMYEIESATYFSSAKLMSARLLAIGAGDAAMLGFFLCFAVIKIKLGLGSTLLYLLLPGLMAGAGLTYLVSNVPQKRFTIAAVGMCASMFMLTVSLALICPSFFRQTMNAGWAAVCVAIAAFAVANLAKLTKNTRFAEMQLS